MSATSQWLNRMDHYDAYTFTTIGAVSFFSALMFIVVNLKFPEARKFPSNLLLVVSLAELFLSAHWLASGIYTPYIMGVSDIPEDSLFCRANSYVAFFFANVEFLFHVSFGVAIIVTFKNTLTTLKVQNLFWILPLLAALVTFGYAIHKEILGKNIYGSCSLKATNHTGRSYLMINGGFIALSLYAIWVLKKFMALERKKIFFKDDFYSFYFNYIILVIVLYLVLGTNYVLAGYIMECFAKDPESALCHRIYFMSKIVNTIKIFTPLWAFLVRVTDPFYLKLFYSWLWRRQHERHGAPAELNSTLLDEEPSYIIIKDFAVNNTLREVKKSIVRTIIHGLAEYYRDWIRSFDNNSTNSFVEKIEIILRARDPTNESSVGGLTELHPQKQIFDCTVSAIGALTFKRILAMGGDRDVHSSFQTDRNEKGIEKVANDGSKGGDTRGGAGGEFMMRTHDRRYMIKTMTEEELAVLRSILDDYEAHFRNNPNSLITKILGAFTFDFRQTGQKVHVFVMEFVFQGIDNLLFRKYDLKGSQYQRAVLKMRCVDLVRFKKERQSETYKDQDFKNVDGSIKFRPEVRQQLIRQLTEDSAFFWNARLMDYSLLMGVIEVSLLTPEEKQALSQVRSFRLKFSEDGRQAVAMGVIDYFQKYNLRKFFEKHGKRVQNCSCSLETSAQSPDYYSERFVEFIKHIFV